MDEEQITDPTTEEKPETTPSPPPPPAVEPETAVTPVPEPEIEPVVVPEPMPTPAPTPDPVPATPPSSSVELTTGEPREIIDSTPQPPAEPKPSEPIIPIPKPQPKPIPVPEPLVTTHQSPITATFDVASLSDDQLKAAAALYAKKNQKTLSQLGVAKRQETAKQNISSVTNFIHSHSPASNTTIARALNLPPKTVQYYMQMLTKNGTVTATGWGASRRYTIQ